MTVRGIRKTETSRDRDRSKIRVDEKPGSEPTKPHGLTPAAERIWQETVDCLREEGRLHASQSALLERWAIAVDRARVIDARLYVEGLTTPDNERAHPLLNLSVSLLEKIRMMARELGATPASRLPTLKPADKTDDAPISPIAALMQRKTG